MNPDAALSAGVNPKRMVLITLFMSGAVAGMIGLPFLLSDPSFLKYGDAFPTTIGFTGLGIALLGRNNPVGIAAAAIVWATIERATQRLGPLGIPQEIGRIMQGSFLLAAVIAYEVVRRRNDAAAVAAAAAATRDERPPPPATCDGTDRSDVMTATIDTAPAETNDRRRSSARPAGGSSPSSCSASPWSRLPA